MTMSQQVETEPMATVTKIMTEDDFLDDVRKSIDSRIPLDLSGYTVTLTKGAIRLRGTEQLEIHGGIIEGPIHSLFQIDGDKKLNPRRLTLRNSTLRHTKVHEDSRQIGAAIFAMGSCVVVLENCDISSKGGFAIWGKHRCHITVDNCQIHDVARTAVACFNECHVIVRNTTMVNVGIHGVCGRAVSVMEIFHCTMQHCATRAVMVYEGAQLTLEDCVISGTGDPTTPTIHAQGPSETDSKESHGDEKKIEAATTKSKGANFKAMIPTLVMRRCKVQNSAGTSLLIEGQVEAEISQNEII